MHDVKPTTGDTSWFTHDRFGLFIHWGLYALAARHEWVQNNEQIPPEEYEAKYFKHFDPDLYDPEEWAKAASNAGMKYFVVTTKHHEGFCLWDTMLTDYKSINTPCGRDLIRPMVEAFRNHNMRVGLYHSLIDWHHPNYTIQSIHPLRNHPDKDKLNEGRDLSEYREYLHGQVREILTRFGRVDVLFLDFSYGDKGRDAWDSERLVELIRELQPQIILNDRLDLQDVEGGWDIRTPEQFLPRKWVEVNGQKVVWETCQTFSGSWGYHRDESSWKSVDQLVRMLIEVVSMGGNLLLNVGPTGRGEFDARALDRLQGMGEWMKRHDRSIYGCTQAPDEFTAPQDCRLTYNPETNRMYVHIFAWPFRHLHLDGFRDRVEYAQLLNDASEVPLSTVPEHERQYGDADARTLTLNLPVVRPDVAVPVVELYMK
ncbi:MAG: alpha-L-fucosidase [Armatimonadia bacterium]|nr:alpha-L-fucosidase [Armatimonadia bacterium]